VPTTWTPLAVVLFLSEVERRQVPILIRGRIIAANVRTRRPRGVARTSVGFKQSRQERTYTRNPGKSYDWNERGKHIRGKRLNAIFARPGNIIGKKKRTVKTARFPSRTKRTAYWFYDIHIVVRKRLFGIMCTRHPSRSGNKLYLRFVFLVRNVFQTFPVSPYYAIKNEPSKTNEENPSSATYSFWTRRALHGHVNNGATTISWREETRRGGSTVKSFRADDDGARV